MKKLNDIPKENPFLVPDNYFEKLEQEVMVHVQQLHKVNRRRKIYTITAATAAVIALLVTINLWIFSPNNNASETQLAENPTTNNSLLLASGNENNVLSTGDAIPAVEFEDGELDNVDYQILDYYSDEMSQLDYLY